jgi:enamine deaminase RidA (YjgF/YER057c/UK114 family)
VEKIMSIDNRLEELGITLPVPAAPVATYVGYVQTGNLVSVSGNLPFDLNGQLLYKGKVGAEISMEDAQLAARQCAINIIAQMKDACDGNLDRVKRVVRLGGFVNCTDGYENQPFVINGASDLMVEVFGDKGRHSRAAVGTNALPLGTSVEVDCMFEIED